MTDPAACDTGGRCITCGDEGIPMEVVSVGDDTATCRDGEAVNHEVMIDLVAPVAPGDAILVHAGTAIGHQRGVLLAGKSGGTPAASAERLVADARGATGHRRGVL